MTLDFRVLTEQVSQNAVSRDLGVAVHFRDMPTLRQSESRSCSQSQAVTGRCERLYSPRVETSLQYERLPANEWPDYRYEHEEFNQCASLVS